MDVRKLNFNVVATTLAPEAGIKGAWDSLFPSVIMAIADQSFKKSC
jgi:hypothetical protein